MADIDTTQQHGVILFDYRGLKFTFRLNPPDQNADGDDIEDIYFTEGGQFRSHRVDALLQYGDVIADILDAERAKGGAQAAAVAHGAVPLPPQPVAYAPGPGGVPTMVPPPAPVPPAPAGAATELCPAEWCRQPTEVKQTKTGGKVQCTNPNHVEVGNDGRSWPFTVRWLTPQRGGRR